MTLAPQGYAPNPHIAFAWLWINDVAITVDDTTGKPRHLESFWLEEEFETVGSFGFTLFDPEYDFIEDQIAKAKGKCKFQFGYTPPGEKSAMYQGTIIDYVPEFLHDGIRINLSGFLEPFNMVKTQVTKTFVGKKISQIVEEIAKSYGMKTDIDETEPLQAREDLDLTDLQDAKWQQHGSDWNLILRKLAPFAVRQKDGAGGYVTYYDGATNTLHFHVPRNEEGPIRTFVWREGKTEVISFTPKYDGNMLGLTFVGGGMQAPVMNAENSTTTPNVQSINKGEGKGKITDPNRPMVKNPASDDDFSATARQVEDFYDQYFAQNAAKYWWYRGAWAASLEAELVIVGDPRSDKLKPLKKYDVQIGKPKGGLHWSSGLYMCLGIKHEISGGQYTSTLTLMRDGAMSGEVASPRPSA